jgi:hypothetical protein
LEHRNSTNTKPFLRPMLMIVLWPAFLMACVATGLFFSLVDPMELIILDERVKVHILGAYTIGFFAFWMLGILSSGLTALLVQKIR